jgi:hypothetical protein
VTLVAGVEVQVEADAVVDAARETPRETHAGVGLLVHDDVSLSGLHYGIDAGIGPRSQSQAQDTWLLGEVLFHGLTPPLDTTGRRVHNILIAGPASQPLDITWYLRRRLPTLNTATR